MNVRIDLTAMAVDDELRRMIAREAGRCIDELLTTLGIPGASTIEFGPAAGGSSSPVRFVVNGRACRYPSDLVGLVAGDVLGSHEAVVAGTADPKAALMAMAASASGRVDTARKQFASAIALLCQFAVSLRPSLLLSAEGLRVLLAAMPPDIPQSEWLGAALRFVLDQRIALNDLTAVAECLESAPDRNRATEAIVEALQPSVLRLQVAPDLLRTLTEQDTGRDLIPYLRDSLFEELGVTLPALKFEPSPQLRPGRFALVPNHLPTPPRLGLSRTQLMVDATAEELADSGWTDVIPAFNPAARMPAAILNDPEGRRSELGDRTVWDTWGHFVLSLAADVRQYACHLVSSRSVGKRVDRFRVRMPAQTGAADNVVGLTRLTALLRNLVRERVSVRDLPLILDVALDAVDAEGWNGVPLGDEEMLRRVRIGLGRVVTSKASRRTATLVCYLLDPDVERLVRRFEGGMPDVMQDQLLDAIAAEVAALPPSSQMPNLITNGDIRADLWAAIAVQFPSVSVLSYDEVPADWNIQPIDRLNLPGG